MPKRKNYYQVHVNKRPRAWMEFEKAKLPRKLEKMLAWFEREYEKLKNK